MKYEALTALTAQFRTVDINMEFDLMADTINDVISDKDEDEFIGYLVELRNYFLDLTNTSDLAAVTQRFIGSLSWDNFLDDPIEDEDVEFYSLGSMFYNKLTWIAEGSDDDDAIALALKLLEGDKLQTFLDIMEQETK